MGDESRLFHVFDRERIDIVSGTWYQSVWRNGRRMITRVGEGWMIEIRFMMKMWMMEGCWSPESVTTAWTWWSGAWYFLHFYFLFFFCHRSSAIKESLKLSRDAFVKSLCSAATSAAAAVGGTHLKLFLKLIIPSPWLNQRGWIKVLRSGWHSFGKALFK